MHSYSNPHFLHLITRLWLIIITFFFSIDSMFSFLSASPQVDMALYDSYLHC